MNNQILSYEKIDIHEYAENAAAIMYEWKEDTVAYQELYDAYGSLFGGFIGIQSIAADAAIVFTQEAEKYTAGEDYYWVEAIEEYACHTFNQLQSGIIPSPEDLKHIAAASIEKCRID